MTRRVLFLILVLALVWLSSPFEAGARLGARPGHSAPTRQATGVFIFQTDMFGKDQVPPVESIAWGFVRFFFSDDRLEADYTVDVKGFSGSLVEGADIHQGPPGVNGPVVRHLADGGFIVTAGRLRLTPEELAEMVSGAWYVSLKTKPHPQGELRGQVIVPEGFVVAAPPVVVAQTLPPVQVQPPSPAAAAAPQTAAAATEGAAPGIVIRPPNTGDGGLSDGGRAALRGLMAGLAAVILGAALVFLSGWPRRS